MSQHIATKNKKVRRVRTCSNPRVTMIRIVVWTVRTLLDQSLLKTTPTQKNSRNPKNLTSSYDSSILPILISIR